MEVDTAEGLFYAVYDCSSDETKLYGSQDGPVPLDDIGEAQDTYGVCQGDCDSSYDCAVSFMLYAVYDVITTRQRLTSDKKRSIDSLSHMHLFMVN